MEKGKDQGFTHPLDHIRFAQAGIQTPLRIESICFDSRPVPYVNTIPLGLQEKEFELKLLPS